MSFLVCVRNPSVTSRSTTWASRRGRYRATSQWLPRRHSDAGRRVMVGGASANLTGNLFIAGSLEDSDKLQVGVSDVLDVMSEIAPDVADVSGIEVHRHRIGAGIEHRHACLALDIVL